MDTANRSSVPACPLGHDQHADNVLLREAGAAAPVKLPGEVPAWAIVRHDALQAVLSDPRFAKSHEHWAALGEGRIPAGWPLMTFIVNKGMTTADGDEHRRLRALVTQAFTPRRVAALRPRIEHLTEDLLDALAAGEAGAAGSAGAGAAGGGAAAAGPVDLRARYAYPLPMHVISELLGVPEDRRDELHRLCEILVSSETAPDDAIANVRALHAALAEIIESKRRAPGDDLTSALIEAREEGDRLSEEELVGTLLLMFLAGHATTLNLICNAVRALLTHPAQLALVAAGRMPWSAVVEETLRWDSPVGHFPMRYATEDTDVGGTLVRKGEPVLASYAAAGRDPRKYGPDAGSFDIARGVTRHLSFGFGAHFCLGAGLARMEAETALARLFARFPGIRLAVPPEALERLPSVVSNGICSLPVLLR
ncbi:cytochrome P450 [Streptomyces sp. NPDC051776]|uniref:cytochrome P450 family protein n=1 Tax=Streptomyces sp. NPDC051776 TaxID=3155414 RepID=UPI0034432A1A